MPASSSVRRRFGSLVLAIALFALQMAPVAATEITTDLWVYNYGDTVTVTGVDYAPLETVELVTTDPYGVEVDRGQVAADELGGFTYAFVLLSAVSGIYDVVGIGLTSGLTASTQFDPPNSPSNLSFVDSRFMGTPQIVLSWAGGNVPTTAANCWIVYRGTSSVSMDAGNATCSGALAGAAIARVAANTTPTYTDSAVVPGTDYYYMVSAVRTDGTSGQNGQSNSGSNQVTTKDMTTTPTSWDFGSVSVGGSSAPKVFTVTNNGLGTIKVNGVVSTGTNAADFSVSGVPTGGSANITVGSSFTFSVTFSPGASGPRSAVLEVRASSTGQSGAAQNIRQIQVGGNLVQHVSAVITAADKVYDGNTDAAYTCALTNVVGTEDVACDGAHPASFADKDVGTWTVTATGLTIGGADSGNYVLDNSSDTDTADITKKDLRVIAEDKSKLFGDPNPPFTWHYQLSDFVAGEGASDIDTPPTCSTTAGQFSAPGDYPITCSGLDNNYNLVPVPGTLHINFWTLKGFYQPVDMGGWYNVVKSGSTVPLKFEVFSGVTELTNTNAVSTFVQTKIDCDGTHPMDEIEVVSTGGTELRYDSTGGQFIQNWKTPKSPGQCYRVTMTTDDGSSLVAFFQLK